MCQLSIATELTASAAAWYNGAEGRESYATRLGTGAGLCIGVIALIVLQNQRWISCAWLACLQNAKSHFTKKQTCAMMNIRGDNPHEQEARVMNERELMPCACYQVTGGG